MIKKEITLCGKPVTLAYCFATEIAYKKLVNDDMLDYAKHAIDSIQSERDPDVERTIYAIIACMMAYYKDEDKFPVKDKDIMDEATPVEYVTAILAILDLRNEFYNIPKNEPEEEKSDDVEEGKNA